MDATRMQKVVAYTDGSANWKTGQGGWGSYLKCDGEEIALCGGLSQTKTGRSEIRAVLETIRHIPIDIETHLMIYSDSQYVVNSFNQGWLVGWRVKSFKGVKNDDLWKMVLYEKMKRPFMKFSIKHIKGHQSFDENDENVDEHVLGNYIADGLADYKSHDVYVKDMSDEEWEKNKSNKKP